ncbi:Plastidial pyruvate kinase 2 [Fagus crenata]
MLEQGVRPGVVTYNAVLHGVIDKVESVRIFMPPDFTLPLFKIFESFPSVQPLRPIDCGMMSLVVTSKTEDSVKCEVVDGGELKSRRHLNVRGKSATLPSITEKDWDDIKFGVDNKVDFYVVSIVKDAQVVHELKNYLQSCGADIHVIAKIESADSIPNLHSIITASNGAMVARGDLGAELPIEEVPLLQVFTSNRIETEGISSPHGKAVIGATNMLESMIVHPTPTRAEVSDIAIAVREGADAVI